MRLAPFLAFLVLAAVALGGAAWADDLGLEASTELSDTGFYTLRWTPPEDGGAVVLQEATAPDFADADVLYRGPDAATVVTGRLDGTYHYRIRTVQGSWTAPVSVEVEHHGAAEALFFLTLGGVVFLATAVLIVGGHRRHRREMAEGTP